MRRISVAQTHRYVVASAFVLAAVTLAVGWRRADVHGVAQVTNSPLCDPRFCGNGLMDPGEQCDPADPASGDRCDPLCRLTCENDGDCPSGECAGGLCTDLCGNGTVDPPTCVPEGGGSLVCPPPSPGEVRVVNLPGGVFPLKKAAGDFNKDGKLDIAVMNYMGNEQTYGSPYDGTIEIFLNTGNGTFATRREIGTFRWNDGGGDRGMDVLDVDKDGDADVVFYDSTSSTNAGLFVLRNDNLTFTRVGPVSNYYAFHLSHADVNGDGDQDIGISGFPWATSGTYGAYVQPGAAGASFDTATWLDPSNGYAPPMFADMDGDGDSDVVNVGYKMVEGGGSYVVNVFTNDGNGSFSPPVEMFVLPTNVTMIDTTIADVNKDGKQDVVLVNGSNGINVILGDGRGGSVSNVTLSLPFRARFVAVADPTADSTPDIIYGSGWGAEGQSLWYAAGKGDGTFEPPVRFVTLTPPPDGPGSPSYNRSDYRTFDLLAADYDGDGRMDLSVTHGSYSDSVSVIFFRSSVEGCIEDPPRILCSQGEECDDGPDNGKSGKCSKQCTYCGNGVINTVNGISEQCDDGNTASGDGCSARCTSESLACTWLLDDGDPNTPMPHCNVVGTTCQGTAQNGVCCCDANLCGNGVIDIVQGIPEACDDGALNGTSTSTCTSQCTITRPVPTLHLACVGIGQCAIVTGPGPDSCLDAQDCSCDPADPSCTHAACVNNACAQVPGPGMPLCSSTADCLACPDSNPNCHMLCDAFTLQCVAAPEGSCVGDCSEPRHLACRNEQCVMVDGVGEHECLSSDDCTAETHLACVGIGQCAIVTGPGPDSCLDAQDCSCDPANPSCTHAACVDNRCIPVPGPGMPLCSSTADCAPCPDANPNCHMLCDAFTLQCVAAPEGSCVGDCSEPRHLACIDEQCTIVDGVGADECASSDDCMLCGNGVVDAGEECDYGDKNGEVCMAPAGVKCTSCSETCSFVETSQCGDDILDDGEACDEGERNRRDPPNDLTEWYCKENSCEISGCFDRGDNDHDGFLDVLDPGCWSYDLTGIARASGPRGRFLGSLLAQSGGRPIRPVPPEEYLPGKDDEACPAQMVDVGQFCALECSEGEICPDGSVCPESGICPPTCGNGIIDLGLGEECDDGNLDDNDACTNQCRLPPCEGGNCPRCGDGVYQSELGEQCDGNDPPDAIEQGCTQNCRLRCTSDSDCPGTCDESVGLCVPAVCGDGVANQDWERCDDGNIVNDDECNNACQPTCKGDADCNSGRCDQLQQICFPTCGNGHLDPDEQCDDGNFVDTDRCTNTCQRYCTDDSTCDCDEETYRCRPLCGNGRVDPSEGCDDGNDVDRDDCSNRCQVRCRPGAMCPGNVLCPLSGMCPLIGVCGDGIVNDASEQCDDGNKVDGDGCSNACTIRCEQNLECPSGLLCIGRECSECTNSLQCSDGFCVEGRCRQALPICGNGVVEPGEVCDDANGDDADGCTSSCLFPRDHACVASAQCQTKLCEGQVCTPCAFASQCGSGLRCAEGNCLFGGEQCGDGDVQAGEACDDANVNDQDQCTNACLLPFGRACTHATQCASTICSAGSCTPCRDDAECAGGLRCAIGLCLTDRQMSLIPNICGNGTLEEDEACDDGNGVYGDGCTPSCQVGNSPSRSEVAANVNVQLPFSPMANVGEVAGGSLHAGASGGLSDTGPATVAVMAAGAAAGTAWVRRKFGKKKR